MIKFNEFEVMKKCPVCNKLFCELDSTVWAYKIVVKKVNGIIRDDFCSWKCMRTNIKSNQVRCVHCGKIIVGHKRKYCDSICRNEHYDNLRFENQREVS